MLHATLFKFDCHQSHIGLDVLLSMLHYQFRHTTESWGHFWSSLTTSASDGATSRLQKQRTRWYSVEARQDPWSPIVLSPAPPRLSNTLSRHAPQWRGCTTCQMQTYALCTLSFKWPLSLTYMENGQDSRWPFFAEVFCPEQPIHSTAISYWRNPFPMGM